jgi:hypothetical protein
MGDEDEIGWDPEWEMDPAASQYADPEVKKHRMSLMRLLC